MPIIASPEQFRILAQAVDDYCRDCGITDTDERLYVAELANSLFEVASTTASQLRQGLEAALGPCRPQA